MVVVVTAHTICESLHKNFYFAAEQDSVSITKKQLTVNSMGRDLDASFL